MQTDYIMWELAKISKFIEAILVKLKVLKRDNRTDSLYGTAKIELAEKLDIDIDDLLAIDNPAEVLVTRYGFSVENLDKFAELLFDMIAPEANQREKPALILAIKDIYRYLENQSVVSLNRYYILKELENFND